MQSEVVPPPYSQVHFAPAGKVLYQRGLKADHFMVIQSGRVEVMVGKDKLRSIIGSFGHIGATAVSLPSNNS